MGTRRSDWEPWYRAGHDTVLKARRELLMDMKLSDEEFSRGLHAIDGIERYLLRMIYGICPTATK